MDTILVSRNLVRVSMSNFALDGHDQRLVSRAEGGRLICAIGLLPNRGMRGGRRQLFLYGKVVQG